MGARRPSFFGAGRRHRGIGNGDMVASVLFLSDHIDTEMIRCEGNLSTGYLGGDFLRLVTAHIVHCRTFRGNSRGQRQGYGNASVHRKLASVAPKLHIVKPIGALHDGKRSDHGLDLAIAQGFGNLKLGSLREAAVHGFDRCMVFRIGNILYRGILHQIPDEKGARAQKRGEQHCKQALFHAFSCNRRTVAPIFGHIADCNVVFLCRLLCMGNGGSGMLVIQMLVIIAVDLRMQKQSGNVIMRSAHAFLDQLQDLNLGVVHLIRFEHSVDDIELFFKGGQRTFFIFKYGIQPFGKV